MTASHKASQPSRRQFLKWSAVLMTGGVVAACAPAATGPIAQPTLPPVPQAAVATVAASSDLQPGFQRSVEPNPKRGGILKLALPINPQHFDPHQGSITYVLVNVYNHLVTREMSTGARVIVPDLAVRWEANADSTAWTFFLREGVKFHDGTDFSADDVVATFQRIIAPPEGVVPSRQGLLSAVVDKVEAVDPLTVRFTLKSSVPYFLNFLILDDMLIVSKKALEANNFDLKGAVSPGTGPFMHQEVRPTEKWTLAKNPNYWDPELPYLDGLEFIHQQEMVDRGTAVLSGQADMTFNTSTPVRLEAMVRDDVNTALLPGGFSGTTCAINHMRKPFDDARVRRAMHLALNRQNIVKAFADQQPIDISRWISVAASDYAQPTDEVQTLPGYRPDKTEDIAEAKRLMAEAGYPDGFGPVELVTATSPQFADILGPAFADEFKRSLNIDFTIRTVERGLLIEELRAGAFDILIENGLYSMPLAEPTLGWRDMFSCEGVNNWGKYCNPEFDAQIGKLLVEVDPAKRTALIAETRDLLDEEVPLIYLGPGNNSPLWKKHVKGTGLESQILSVWGRLSTAWLDT